MVLFFTELLIATFDHLRVLKFVVFRFWYHCKKAFVDKVRKIKFLSCLRLFVSLVPLTWRRSWRGVRSETWRQSPRGTARKSPRKRQLSWCLRSWRSYLPFPLLSSAPVPRSARKRTKTSSRYGQCVATLFCEFLISYFYVKIHVLWNFKQYGFCHLENING